MSYLLVHDKAIKDFNILSNSSAMFEYTLLGLSISEM
jgi:hypothetical protein